MHDRGETGGFGHLARDSALFTAGSVVGKLVALVVVPFLTRRLSTEDFGRLDVLSTLATAITSIAVLGLDVASTRLYPDGAQQDRRGLFATWATISAVLAAPVALVLWAAGPTLSDALFGSSANAAGFAFVGLYVVGNLFQVVGLTALRNLGRAVSYAAVSASAFTCGGVLTIVLVQWRANANVAMAAVAIGMVVGGVGAVAAARHLVLGRPTRPAATDLLRLGLPLVPALAATWIGDVLNRTILLGAAGATQVGFLSVAVRFGSVGLLLVTGFHLAWQPRAFASATQADGAAATAVDGRRIMVAACAAMLPVGVLAPELVVLFAGSEYEPAIPAVGWLLVQAVAFGLFTVATMPLAIDRRMRQMAGAAIVASLAAIVANLALAPLAGSAGTGAALAVGQLAGVASAVVLARGGTTVPYPWARLLTISGGTSVVLLACTVAPLTLAPRLGLLALAAVALWFEGTLRAVLRPGRRGGARSSAD